ncbi:restriction endonuclease subunit S [Clostridium perfringens]|nr:restriction endonuclease subunit S [Clostridium perfringens]
MNIEFLKNKILQQMIQDKKNSSLNTFAIGELLTRVKEPITVEDSKEYNRVTIRTKNKGIYIRDKKLGINIGTKRQFLVKEGLFLLSKIDARNGAFGIAPKEINGAIVTNDFLAYKVNKELLDINWFNFYVATEYFIEICKLSSFGSTNRKRLKEEKFLEFRINLPSIKEQKSIVKRIKTILSIIDEIDTNKEGLLKDIENVRKKVLQLAIQGKLVNQCIEDESVDILLNKIKKEKETLIREKKIKKEKKLEAISEEEIPFELPKEWKWCRLGEIVTVKGGKRVPAGYKLLDIPTNYMYIRVADMKNGTIVDSDIKYISEEIYEKIQNYYIESDDIYITIAGTIGRVGLVPEKFNKANLTENAAKIKCYYVNKKFIFNVLNSNFIQSQISDKTKKVGQPKLALNQILSLIVPIPPVNEQIRIVKKLNEIMTYINNLEGTILESFS